MAAFKVAIAGMTGKFARLIITHLLSKPNVEITGFARTPSKVPQEISSNPRVTVFSASSTDTEKIRQAIKGADICICCYLGDDTLMEDGQKQLIDACIAEKVPRFMDSGYTFDYRSLEKGAAPQKDFCKAIQAYLEGKSDKIKGVQILNGAFTEVVFAPFYGLFNADGPTLSYWGNGDDKLEMTTYETAANFAAEVALDKNAVGYNSVLGDRKSVKEIASIFQQVYGVQVQLKRLGSLEELYKQMRTSLTENPQNMYAWMGSNYFYHGLNGSTYLPKKLDSERYQDLKPTTIEDFFKRQPLKTLNEAYIF